MISCMLKSKMIATCIKKVNEKFYYNEYLKLRKDEEFIAPQRLSNNFNELKILKETSLNQIP